MLLRPPYLQKGDSVVIIATARSVMPSELDQAIEIFKSWGLHVRLGKTIGLADHRYGGTDAERREDFQTAINDPEIKAIFCARGGYGTVRIIDDIDWTGLLTHPKWIVGFSDATYIHIHLNQTLGVQTLHAAVPAFFHENTPEAIDSIRLQLTGETVLYDLPPHPFNRNGSARGSLIGGNLSILYSITGTKSGFNTSGKILFIEDIGEQLYHIDRMMMNLKRSAKLQDLAGLIVGGMTDMKDDEKHPFGKTAEAIVAEHVANFDYPVCFGFPAGHIPDNRALVMGKMTEINVTKNEASVK
jgi:muramoyltetrapeptide carboxypeptidase